MEGHEGMCRLGKAAAVLVGVVRDASGRRAILGRRMTLGEAVLCI